MTRAVIIHRGGAFVGECCLAATKRRVVARACHIIVINLSLDAKARAAAPKKSARRRSGLIKFKLTFSRRSGLADVPSAA
jgi:hypothetical protein